MVLLPPSSAVATEYCHELNKADELTGIYEQHQPQSTVAIWLLPAVDVLVAEVARAAQYVSVLLGLAVLLID